MARQGNRPPLHLGALAHLAISRAAPPLLFDVREPEEFAVSHLPGARRVGGVEDALRLLEGEPKDRAIVAYCSVGVRSGTLVEELRARGFGNVRNLSGSIFAWANAELPLRNADGPTERVHPFDATWGRFLRPEFRSGSDQK